MLQHEFIGTVPQTRSLYNLRFLKDYIRLLQSKINNIASHYSLFTKLISQSYQAIVTPPTIITSLARYTFFTSLQRSLEILRKNTKEHLLSDIKYTISIFFFNTYNFIFNVLLILLFIKWCIFKRGAINELEFESESIRCTYSVWHMK